MSLPLSLLIPLHLLFAAIWVGGMFFAVLALRPAAFGLDPAVRLPLWSRTLERFFTWVQLASIIVPTTGYIMIFAVLGGMKNVGIHVHIMQGLGWVMIFLFMHVYFAPYRRLRKAIDAGDLQTAGKNLEQIRKFVTANLVLGLIVMTVATAGRYL